MDLSRTPNVPSSNWRAPAAMAALMAILAAALAVFGGGCGSSARAPTDGASDAGDTEAPVVDSATDTRDTASPTPDGALTDVALTDVATDIGDAALSAGCSLDAVYTYGNNGGLVAFTAETVLSPPASYRHTTTNVGLPEPPPPLTCAPALPACGDATRIDVSDLVRDLADPDVTRALAMSTPPLYGMDQRPVDGTMYQVLRGDGHGFLAGAPCDTGSFCHGPVPAGIARLVADLHSLDQQQLSDPSCASQP